MRKFLDWTVDCDDDGWYLEWWPTGGYWTQRQRHSLTARRFEDAIVEARIFLNLE